MRLLNRIGLLAISFALIGGAQAKTTIVVESAPPRKPDDPGCKSCLQQAASLFARGQGGDAEKQLREWAPKCPNNAQFHLLFSTVLISRGQTEDAERESGLAANLNPSSIAAHLQHALTLTAVDRKVQAAKEYERVLQIDPSSYEAWTALVTLYRQLHLDDKATEAAAKAADLEPHSKSQRMATLANLKRAGKFTEARAEIDRLLNAPTTSPEFAEELAREALLVGAFDQASTAAAKAIAAHPNSAAPLMISALGHFCDKNYDASVTETTKAAELEPANNDAKALRALALTKEGKVDQAETALGQASDTNSTMYLLTKGTIEADKNNLTAAEESLLACLQYDQGNNALQGIPHSLARITLAAIYQKQGKSSLASEQLQALAHDKRFAAKQ